MKKKQPRQRPNQKAKERGTVKAGAAKTVNGPCRRKVNVRIFDDMQAAELAMIAAMGRRLK